MQEITTIVLSSGVVAALVSSALNYFFDKSRDKTKQNIEIKQQAYMKAVSAISGVADNAVDFILQKKNGESTSSLTLLNYLTNFQRELALVFLVVNDEIRRLLKKFAPLIKKGGFLVRELVKDAKPTDDGYIAGTNGELVVRIENWAEEIETLEKEVLVAIQKDLGLRE